MPRDDHVLLTTRILAALIVPILVAAFLILYLSPEQSGARFAWPVRPPMTAMMLGATYLGGAYFFTRVVFARRWHWVTRGFLPVTAFASILGVATILHWDRFSHGRFPFQLWAFLYFTLPFVLPVVWVRNRAEDPGQPAAGEALLPGGVRTALVLVGAVLSAAALLLLLFPQWMIPAWPWTLTPLTARIMSAMFALPGLVSLGIAADQRQSVAPIIVEAEAIAIALILVAAVRARGDVNWLHPAGWTFVGGMLSVLLISGWAYLLKTGPQRPGVKVRAS
jgi:hypothetical protein